MGAISRTTVLAARRSARNEVEVPTQSPSTQDGGRLTDVLLLALTGSFLFVSLVGEIYPSEVILAGLIPAILFRVKKSGVAVEFKPLLRLITLWWLLEMAGGLLHGAHLEDLARGTASLFLFGCDFVALTGCLALIGGDERRLARGVRRMMVALATAGLLGFLLVPTLLSDQDPWKFGYGMSLTFLVVVMASYAPPALGGLALLFMAGVNVLFDFRSLALILAITAALVISRSGSRRAVAARQPKHGNRNIFRRTVAASCIVLAVSYGLFGVYRTLATNGSLGDAAREKYRAQVGQNDSPVGLILGGRTELFFYYRAIVNSPVIGLGPRPVLPAEDVARTLLTIHDQGYQLGTAELRYFAPGAPLPLHSYLFGAVVQGGLLAALAWISILRRAVAAATARAHRVPSVIVVFVAVNLMWNIAFSPFGSSQRILVAFSLAVLFASGRSVDVIRA